MNHSVKRTHKSHNGLPSVDDVTLIGLALGTPALMNRDMNDPFCVELVALSKSIKKGKFGQLPRKTRDQLIKFVAEAGALPRLKPAHKAAATYLQGEHYDIKRSSGTAFAERLLYQADGTPKPIPAPIRRRSA